MPTTLSKFKSEFILAVKWAAIILGIIIGIFILIKTLSFVKELVFPTPAAPPNASFGKLPPILFPESINKKYNYKIDTLKGGLPNLPDRTKVYEMIKPSPDLLAVKRASEKVSTLGFIDKPEQLSESIFRWNSEQELAKSLVLNVNMASFTLYSPYLTDPSVISAAYLKDEENAISVAREFLTTLGILPEDLDEQKTRTELFTINDELVGPVNSLSQAKLISVYFFQKNIEDTPIVYPSGLNSNMNLVIGSGRNEAEVVNARFFYQKISDKSSTYAIKTSDEAFDELKKGEGKIVSYNGKGDNVTLKKIYIALYSEGKEQKYLMPVIVFEGNENFVAYVSAIKDDWIKK